MVVGREPEKNRGSGSAVPLPLTKEETAKMLAYYTLVCLSCQRREDAKKPTVLSRRGCLGQPPSVLETTTTTSETTTGPARQQRLECSRLYRHITRNRHISGQIRGEKWMN